MATKAEHVTALKAEHPSLTKMIDGVRITLSDSEYETHIDNWAAGKVAGEARAVLEADGGQTADYKAFRVDSAVAGSYPYIGDQLDMLYHDIDDEKFGADAKTGTWYVAIKATKDKFTKPE